MRLDNLARLQAPDTVKFVCGSHEDLEAAAALIRAHDLIARCHVYLSPVFGALAPAEMVDYMLTRRLNGVRLQLQMHKYIWDPDKRGV